MLTAFYDVRVDVSKVILYNALVEILDRFQKSTEQRPVLDVGGIEAKEIVLAGLDELVLCLVSLFVSLLSSPLPGWLYSCKPLQEIL